MVNPDSFSQLSDEFICWLRQNPEVRISPKIRITDLRSKGAGRGVVASADIDNDEVLFAIPQHLVLSVQNSKLKTQLHIEDDLGPWLYLILVMIYEYLQGEASRWAPYFRVLPAEFDTLMFWTDAELRELQGSAVINKIGKQDADESILQMIVPLISKNSHLFPLPAGVSSFDSPGAKESFLALAHQMGSLIMAYAFDLGKGDDEEIQGQDGYVTDDEEELPKGMVPLADLLNADGERNNARLFQEDGSFVMKSIKAIPNGQEIFNDYGKLPRAELLRRYGYVTENYAQYDVVELPLNLICEVAGLKDPSGQNGQPQLEFLEELGLIEDGYNISRLSPEEPVFEAIPDDLLILLQTLNLSSDQLNQLRTKSKPPKPVLRLAEAKLLRDVIQRRQCEYSTSVTQDQELLMELAEELLGSNDLGEASNRRYKMAIQVREGEKHILSQLLQSLEEYIARESQTSYPNRSAKRNMQDDKRRGRKRNKT